MCSANSFISSFSISTFGRRSSPWSETRPLPLVVLPHSLPYPVNLTSGQGSLTHGRCPWARSGSGTDHICIFHWPVPSHMATIIAKEAGKCSPAVFGEEEITGPGEHITVSGTGTFVCSMNIFGVSAASGPLMPCVSCWL